uniref:Uncharacterized protein n=1 Tax=Rhizophora mucronata TaxID=61149 RepID=A0A2P2IXF8_RHIMU
MRERVAVGPDFLFLRRRGVTS